MIEAEYCDICGILVVRAGEPFTINELLDGAKEAAVSASLEKILGNPVLLDFRAVSLVKFNAEDFRRVVRKRLEFTKEHTNVPYALIARSDADFGMLRMYAAYVEIGGLRSAENTCVTTNFAEGVEWLIAKSRCSKRDSCLMLDQMTRLPHPD